MSQDERTANAFANSWNRLPGGSIYTLEQFEDWLAPITRKEIEGKTVLELGCGNGSLLVHLIRWKPSHVTGVDLGASTEAARKNLQSTGFQNHSVVQADLTTFSSEGFDVVYCIGVLHHLEHPARGLDSVIANVKPGGRFHCWVYAREGNRVVIRLVDPLRKMTACLPWWMAKYLIATPLVLPFFIYAKLLRILRHVSWMRKAPLFDYGIWIAQRPFSFFRHVAFDQLLAPQTRYVEKTTVESWLKHPRVVTESSYIIFRNGNSWKFGGIVR
jgi:SAM-dependent methyltransferase